MKVNHSLTTAIVISTFVLAIPLSFATEAPFSDVQEGNSHFIALQFLKQQNFIKGYEDGTFKPQKDITRAEALKMLLTAINKTKKSKNKNPFSFSDVKKDDWLYEIIKKAFENQIIEGYPDQLFHPEKNITRAESLKVIMLQSGVNLPVEIADTPYTDIPLESWISPFAQVSKERGLFLGTRTNGGELLPLENVSRGQFAELIYRLLKSNQGIKFARATYYADSLAGRGTSSGDLYQPKVLTTAHRTLPLGTKLLVKNLANGKEVEVKVNDRGPYATGIDLDLSKSAFAAIGSPSTGIITVEFKVVSTSK